MLSNCFSQLSGLEFMICLNYANYYQDIDQHKKTVQTMQAKITKESLAVLKIVMILVMVSSSNTNSS